jgi:hypothetical protein
MRNVVVSFALIGALIAASGTATAQSDEQRANARALADQGVQAFSEGRWQDTVDLFERAESLLDAPTQNAKCVSNGTGGASGAGGGEVTGGTSSGGTGDGDAGAVDTGGSGGTAGTVGSGGDGASGNGISDAGSSILYARSPGGCACRIGSDRGHDTSALIGVALTAFAWSRRRRSNRAGRIAA